MTTSASGTSSSGTTALVAVVGVIGVGLWYLFGPIPRSMQRWVHDANENPLSTPTTRGKRVAYRLYLSRDTVHVAPSGNALIYRNGALLAQFTPLPHQMAKIRLGEGVLLVFTDQLIG